MTIKKDNTSSTDTRLQQKIITQVEKRLPYLTAGNVYTVAAILGEKFWEDDDDAHRSIGQSFSHLVSNNRLPFIQVGWNAVRHNEYHYTPKE